MWVDFIVWFGLMAWILSACRIPRPQRSERASKQASKEGEGNFIHIRVMKLGASIYCVTNQASV